MTHEVWEYKIDLQKKILPKFSNHVRYLIQLLFDENNKKLRTNN